MKSINLLSPGESPEEEIVPEQTERLYEEKNTERSVGFILLLLLALILAWVLYQPSRPQNKHLVSDTTLAELREKRKAAITPKAPPQSLAERTPSSLDSYREDVNPDKEDFISETVPVRTPREKIFAVDKREYSLILDNFSTYKEAKKFANKLTALGFEPYQQRFLAKQTVHVVYVGNFTSYRSAKKVQRRLRKEKFDTYLPTNQGRNFRVRIGIFRQKRNAARLLKKLQAKGYDAKLEITQMKLPKHEIRVGKYKTYQTAKAKQQELQSKGINSILFLKQQGG